MNIRKAILLTALLIGVEVLISFGFYEWLEPQVTDFMSSVHYFGITNRIPSIIAYCIVFCGFSTVTFDYSKGLEKIKKIQLVNDITIGFI